MNDSSPEYLTNFAIQLAQKAGKLLMKHFGKVHEQIEKESFHSIVTSADVEVETFIKNAIAHTFPHHKIVSEESGATHAESEFIWVIDPLDGSSYYARGIPSFSVSIALIKGHSVILGVVENPFFNETFHAFLSMGAFLNRNAISVSTTTALSSAIFNFGHRYLRSEGYKPASVHNLMAVRSIRGGGSCAQELCQIACGRIDGLVTVNQASWDFFAGKLIVEEAGGKLTELNGEAIHPLNALMKHTDIVATNGLLHIQN
ncbi:MAG: inositol monophosphatase [Chitinophagales bacterium]|nr:inositol monophosphatase [Chitinophagales bacterium]